MKIEEKAAELRREYMRNWRLKNKEKVKRYTQSYWERKALNELTNKPESEDIEH
jgi:hypothetical protein